MAFSVTVSSKQPGEVKTYRVDFTEALDAAWIEVPQMTVGVGLNDLSTSGTYFGATDVTYLVKIAATGSPDTFQWSNDNGQTWSDAIGITGDAQLLEKGIYVTFGAATGHTQGDTWQFTAHCQELIDTAVATAYEWDVRAQVNRTYDLVTTYAGADEVEIAIYAQGELLGRDSISLSPGQRTLYFQAINDLPWLEKPDFIASGSVGWGDIDGKQMVWFRTQGGEDRHSYKVTVRAVSTKEKTLEADIIIPVEEV